MEWVANDAFPFTTTPEQENSNSNRDAGSGGAATGGGGGGGGDGDEEMGDAASDDAVKKEPDADGEGGVREEVVGVKEEDGDLDVAEDEDRWL